jgi:hypothetical protein
MSSSVKKYIGLEVHKEAIAIAVLRRASIGSPQLADRGNLAQYFHGRVFPTLG